MQFNGPVLVSPSIPVSVSQKMYISVLSLSLLSYGKETLHAASQQRKEWGEIERENGGKRTKSKWKYSHTRNIHFCVSVYLQEKEKRERRENRNTRQTRMQKNEEERGEKKNGF